MKPRTIWRAINDSCVAFSFRFWDHKFFLLVIVYNKCVHLFGIQITGDDNGVTGKLWWFGGSAIECNLVNKSSYRRTMVSRTNVPKRISFLFWLRYQTKEFFIEENAKLIVDTVKMIEENYSKAVKIVEKPVEKGSVRLWLPWIFFENIPVLIFEKIFTSSLFATLTASKHDCN